MQVEEVRTWIKRHISTIAFVGGFIGDVLTLKRIDFLFENLVFISYLSVALAGIFLIQCVETGRWTPRFLVRAQPWLPVVVQIPFGGLFSGFIIFYTKSASILSSWPFLMILALLFVGNEFFRRRYERLVFQLGVFYFALLSYLVLVTPIITKSLGTSTFVISGLASLFVIAGIFQALMRLFPELYRRSIRGLVLSVGGIFIGWNALYFTNAIPPVPLALRDIGIYHSVVRVGGEYRVTYEEPAWYTPWRSTSATFHRSAGEAAYCFSSIFAPTALTANVSHSWQRRDDSGSWQRVSQVPFVIAGGRDEGYRGYTLKQNLTEGDWRCVVEVEGKAVVGETSFRVVSVDTAVTLTDGVK